MNLDLHTVEVKRRGTSTTNKVETSTGFATVYAALICLIEPMGSYRRATLLGIGGGRKYHLSWEGGETLLDGDRVLWQGRKFRLDLDQDDQFRSPDGLVPPYQSAILHEEST